MTSRLRRHLPFPHEGFTPAEPRRPRVLVEALDPALAWAAGDRLRANGYAVAECWGPTIHTGAACPLLEDGRCPLVEGADCVVQCLGRGTGLPILAAIRERFPDTPVCVELPGPAQRLAGDTLDGCDVIERLTPGRLLRAVARATMPTRRWIPVAPTDGTAPFPR